MITYENLRKKPQVAKSLVGMSLVEFEQFYFDNVTLGWGHRFAAMAQATGG